MRSYDELLREYEKMCSIVCGLLEHSSRHTIAACSFTGSSWIPLADIHETESTYYVFVELPGIDPSKIQLMVEGNLLFLNGRRDRLQVEGCISIHQKEIDTGAFRRIFQFPTNLDTNGAQSSYKHGILQITLPKAQGSVPIQVSLRRG